MSARQKMPTPQRIPPQLAAWLSEQWRPRFAVKAVSDFLEEPLLLPGANDNILATDYIRIGKSGRRETFNIMDTLKATEQRKRGGK